MISGSVARRYAKALLAIGKDSGGQPKIDAFATEIGEVAKAIRESDDLRRMLSSKQLPLSQRQAAFTEILSRLGASQTVRTLLTMLLERGRIGHVDTIEREYRNMADDEAGRVRAEAISARPISEDLARRVGASLQETIGKQVLLERTVDPSIIGGLRVKVGSLLYEGSVRARLEELRDRLLPEP